MGGLRQCFVNLCFFLPSLSRKVCGGFSCKAGSTTVLPHPPRTLWAVARLCASAVLLTGDSHGPGLPLLPEGSRRARLIPHKRLWSLGLLCLRGAQQSLLLVILHQLHAFSLLTAHLSVKLLQSAPRRDFKCKKPLWVVFLKGFLSSHLSLFQST